MQVSELKKLTTDLGLKHQVENSVNSTIMQVWQPNVSAGFLIDDKVYNPVVLGKKQVQMLNSKFEELLQILKTNKISIQSVHQVENGIISTWILDLKQERVIDVKQDFEIESNVKNKLNLSVDYSQAMPTKIGYNTSTGIIGASFLYDKIKISDLDMLMMNIDELIQSYGDNKMWITQLSVAQNTTKPIKVCIEKNLLTPKKCIEQLFSNGDIYYKQQTEYTKILTFLSQFKIDDVVLKKNNVRGNFPDLVIESNTIFKNIMKNWEFEKNTADTILTFLIQDEHIARFNEFTSIKDAKKYKLNDWFDQIEPCLKTICNNNPKLSKRLINEGWIVLEDIDYSWLIDFICESINAFSSTQIVLLLIQEFMRINPEHNKALFTGLFDTFDKKDLHDSFESREVMEFFISNIDQNNILFNDINLFIRSDAAIMVYIEQNSKIYNKLITNTDFINYLISLNKAQYIPQTIKDIFFI